MMPSKGDSFRDILKKLRWENLHKDVLNKGKSIDRIIEVTQLLIDEIFDDKEKESGLLIGELVKDIPAVEIRKHFINSVIRFYNKEGEHYGDERGRSYWNLSHNLLRGLRKYKDDAGFYLLPEEDQKLTLDFIGKLKHPPRDYYPL